MMKRAHPDTDALYASKMFDVSYRATSNDLSSVKIYTNRNSYEIEKQISFDSEYEPISSLEYFAGSVLSSVLLSLLEESKRRGSIVEEIEGVLHLSLENPLSMIGVKGYEEEPFVRKMIVTVFVYADLEDQAFDEFCRGALAKSPIYNTLKRSMELEVRFKPIG